MILDVISNKLREEQEQYTLWDSGKCYYHKGIMFRGDMDGSVPLPCFRTRYNGKQLPIGLNLDFLTCEIISDLISDAVKTERFIY